MAQSVFALAVSVLARTGAGFGAARAVALTQIAVSRIALVFIRVPPYGGARGRSRPRPLSLRAEGHPI
jgi:hypothetical protein